MLNFIVNVQSGKGKGAKHLQKITKYCGKNRIKHAVFITEYAGHAAVLAADLCKKNQKIIVAVGGDGTFHEVLGGINPETCTLGFIPSGRGNDFAAAQRISLDPIVALEAILKNEITEIDYFTVGEKRCLNVAGTGLDIDVLQRINGRQGKITYLKSLIYCLKNFDPYKISVTKEDGVVTDYDSVVACVCNGSQFGAGMKISPLSVTNDGLLNVVIINMPFNQKLLPLMARFIKGKHLGMDITTHYPTKQVKIVAKKPYPVQLDGEIYQDLDFDCQVVKGGLKTFVTR